MKYKVVLIVMISFLLIGCSDYKEDILECDIGNTVITLTVKNGKIIKYNDKIQGDLKEEEIAVLNNSHLTDIDNNQDALSKLREVIASSGGNCK